MTLQEARAELVKRFPGNHASISASACHYNFRPVPKDMVTFGGAIQDGHQCLAFCTSMATLEDVLASVDTQMRAREPKDEPVEVKPE